MAVRSHFLPFSILLNRESLRDFCRRLVELNCNLFEFRSSKEMPITYEGRDGAKAVESRFGTMRCDAITTSSLFRTLSFCMRMVM